MPIYEYSCEKCGHYEDFLEKVNAPSLKKCPSCGKKAFKRLVSLSSFQLKGAGWYVTDFRDKAGKKDKASDAGDAAAETKTGKGDDAAEGGRKEKPKGNDAKPKSDGGSKTGSASKAAA